MKLPPPLRQIYAAWMGFSKMLGRVMSAILLTVVWVVIFGIYAIVMKIGRLFMQKTDGTSTWIDCTAEDASTMKHSF